MRIRLLIIFSALVGFAILLFWIASLIGQCGYRLIFS